MKVSTAAIKTFMEEHAVKTFILTMMFLQLVRDIILSGCLAGVGTKRVRFGDVWDIMSSGPAV